MGQRLFLSQMRLELLLSSTDVTAYWQKRAKIFNKRHFVQNDKTPCEKRVTHNKKSTPRFYPLHRLQDKHSRDDEALFYLTAMLSFIS